MNLLNGYGEILILKNIEREDAGILGDIIKEHGIKHKVIDLNKGEKPGPVDRYAAVIVLGGPDSANDKSEKMEGELALIRDVLDLKIPYLGICLGLQTMVKAAGGQVVKSPVNEIGFRDEKGDIFKISLTREGLTDPLFDGIGDSFNVFQLHGESVIPARDMKLLATGKYCPNQVVKKGENAYGIQCHFEMTNEIFERWINEDPDLLKLDKKEMQSDFMALGESYFQTGLQLFRNFLRIAGFPL